MPQENQILYLLLRNWTKPKTEYIFLQSTPEKFPKLCESRFKLKLIPSMDLLWCVVKINKKLSRTKIFSYNLNKVIRRVNWTKPHHWFTFCFQSNTFEIHSPGAEVCKETKHLITIFYKSGNISHFKAIYLLHIFVLFLGRLYLEDAFQFVEKQEEKKIVILN